MTTFLTAQSLIKDAVQLYSLPDIYFQIREMIRDPRFTAVDIGRVIAKDPALSMRLLKIVNSSFYGFQARIDTISRAITIIGIEELQSLALATSVVDTFADISDELVDMTDFWVKSVDCAVLAKLLAKKSNVLHAERLFVTGLLHDIGALVIYTRLPELAKTVLKQAQGKKRNLPRIEQITLGFTRADVGAELADAWNLPKSLSEAIRWQHTPEKAIVSRLDAHLLNLAIQLSDDRTAVESTLSRLPPATLSILRISESTVKQVMATSVDEFNTVFSLLAPGKQFH
ncbi:MAG: HDOD domain-containing protein [Methylomicrobium sp.]